MRNTAIVTAAMMLVMSPVLRAQQAGIQEQDRVPVSFKQQVFPIIKKHCLPCHAEDNYNPSELVLDTYETLMKGGEHGKALEPGKGAESLIVKKLGPHPPFGKVMPVEKKKKPGEESKNKLTEDEVKALVDWIDQGAKDN